MSTAFAVSGLQQFQKLDDYRLPSEAPFAKRPTADVGGTKKALQRFFVEPVQAVGSGAIAVVSGVWDLIKAILRAIARALGLQQLQTLVKQNAQGQESLEVTAEGPPEAMEQMHAASKHILDGKAAFEHYNSSEPMPEINRLNKEFADIKADVEKFERDWATLSPKIPLASAFGVDDPVYRKYVGRIEQSKAVIVQAQAIAEQHPKHAKSFSDEILLAMSLVKRDLERQGLSPAKTLVESVVAVAGEEDLSNSLRDIPLAQATNSKNAENTTHNDSAMAQSAQLNAVPINPGAHLPGLQNFPLSRVDGLSAINVLPIFHQSNPQNPQVLDGSAEQDVLTQESVAKATEEAPKSSRFGLPAGRRPAQMPTEFDEVEIQAPQMVARERQMERQTERQT